MSTTKAMTITERNQKLYDLRKKLDQKRMELAWIETEIMAVNSQYDREKLHLFEEMFGDANKPLIQLGNEWAYILQDRGSRIQRWVITSEA